MSLSVSQYHCNVCNVTVNSESQLNQHYFGSKHKTNAARNPPTAEQNIEKIKATGMSYFVKEESSSPNQEIPNTVAGNSSSASMYCSTCRINMTSPLQAEAHYTGSKHRQKLHLLQEEINSQSGGDNTQQQASSFDNPDTYCTTCRVKLTSTLQAQVHYSGTKHQQKLKRLEGEVKSGAIGPNAITQFPIKDKECAVIFCETCRAKFTSQSQADTHFNGSKHKHKVILLEEAKNFQNQSQLEGEPSAKKTKFLSICETCNVTLTCPDMVTAHYSGTKHQKKVALWKQMGESNVTLVTNTNVTTNGNQYQYQAIQSDNSYGLRPIQKGDGVKKGGHLFCSFCNLAVNSQAQMDAHRAGSKHKAKVTQIASPSKTTSMVHHNMMQSMSVTTSYTMTSTNPEPFPNPNSISPGYPCNPANSVNPSYPIDPSNLVTSIAPAGAYPLRNNQNPAGGAPYPVY